VPLTARAGARVEAAVPPALHGQRIRLTVDGHRRPVLARPATFSVRGLSGSAAGGWHRLELRGRATTASARFAVGTRSGRNAPTLVLTGAPARVTAPAGATFRFSASGRARVTCAVDGAAHRCSGRVARVSAGPGRHVLTLQARGASGSSTLKRAWTVAAAAPGPAAPGAAAPAPAPAPAAPAPAASAPASAPAADATAPSGWTLLMSDTFDGTRLNTGDWDVYGPRWPGNGGNGVRDGSAVSVGGGVLTITAKMVDGTLVAGAVSSRINRTYGRVEFRARTDADPSAATSGVVLMWPRSDNWPSDGEIDIYETGTLAARSWFSSFVHYGANNRQDWFGHPADATAWHQMAMEWTPDAIRFYRDGSLEGTVTNPAAIPRVPHHLTVQLDAFAQSMTGSVRMQVDDVRIYAPS
jgi:hypothetical protein